MATPEHILLVGGPKNGAYVVSPRPVGNYFLTEHLRIEEDPETAEHVPLSVTRRYIRSGTVPQQDTALFLWDPSWEETERIPPTPAPWSPPGEAP